jgi:ABC-type branched-subunit amino acid transport system substrate-binding protein
LGGQQTFNSKTVNHKFKNMRTNTGVFSILFLTVASLFLAFCNPAKKATTSTPGRKPPVTTGTKPRYEPMDTLRWTPAPGVKPPIGNPSGTTDLPPATPYTGQTYRLAFLLPFLTNQADPESQTVPERSNLALQFYAGAGLALQKLSTEEGLNLSVDVFDTQSSDADFQRLLSNPRIDKAQVVIGPIRPSHVSLMAERIKQTHQILLSPESPNMDLTNRNPDFIQINPSLRAHCAAITRYVLERHRPDAVTLVCKQKEADRLPYFQQSNAPGNTRFAELIVPDAAANFDNIDLRPYFRSGRTAVFILPTWASQDFLMAFLRKLHTTRGNTRVEVYGMPQWRNFENIEPEYFAEMNVHVTSASHIDRSSNEAREFRQAFYDANGTVPNDDAYNGYDVTMFAGKMLKKYGLSFPQRLASEEFEGLHGKFQFAKVFATGAVDDRVNQYDYLENIFVHILKFQNFKFQPAE